MCVSYKASSAVCGCYAISDQLFSLRYAASGAISGNAPDNTSHFNHNALRIVRERSIIKMTWWVTMFIDVIYAIAQLQCLIRLQ